MGCTTKTQVFADMSETEQVRAALVHVTTAFAAAIAQRPQYEAMAVDLVRMADAGEYEALAQLGADMFDRIAQARMGEAH